MIGYLSLGILLLVLELFLGIGVIGIPSGLSLAAAHMLLALKLPAPRRHLRIAGIFFLAALATMGWLIVNIYLAKRNAVPIIQECERFRDEHNRYPASLNELMPGFLPSIPPARYTLFAGHFIYGPDPPELCFSAMFHGVFCYDLTNKAWMTNE